jgi:hypothetical protein
LLLPKDKKGGRKNVKENEMSYDVVVPSVEIFGCGAASGARFEAKLNSLSQ